MTGDRSAKFYVNLRVSPQPLQRINIGAIMTLFFGTRIDLLVGTIQGQRDQVNKGSKLTQKFGGQTISGNGKSYL